MSKKEIDIEREGPGRERKRSKTLKDPIAIDIPQEVAASLPLNTVIVPATPTIEVRSIRLKVKAT